MGLKFIMLYNNIDILPSFLTSSIFQPCIGISIATSVRVGNELGAGNPKGAKRASYASMTIVCKFF